jgi:hypothetical protein
MQTWERQPKEPSTNYQAFALYRNSLGSIDFEDISSQMGLTLKYIEKIAKKWHWKERSNEFNEYFSAKFQSQTDYSADKSENQSLENSAAALRRIIDRINLKMNSSESEVDEMKLDGLIKLLNSFIKTIGEIGKTIDTKRKTLYTKSDEMISKPKIIELDESKIEESIYLLKTIQKYNQDI